MEQADKEPTNPDDEINWPKGRQIKRLLPKFGSNRPPITIFGKRPNGRFIENE
jgi:hypothetical protein